MSRKRRTHNPEFKARIALEALKGIKPVHQIASENEIHPVQVSQWKKEMQERMSELFVRKNVKSKEVTVRWDHGPLHLTGESPLIRSLRACACLSRCAPCPRREAGDLRRLCARDGHQRVRQIGFGVDAVLAA